MSEAVSIVLVHGAWADGSSWAEVIRPLQAKGYRVVAAPIPLTSLTDDVAALDRVIGRTEEGPVILVAHAYAGSASTNKRVKSLVFVAALTPDREKPHPNAPQSIAVACIQERAPKPAWRSKPSFYLIAEDDRNPATQHFIAKRMAAKVTAANVDHAPQVIAPDRVVDIILAAVAGQSA